MPDLVSKNTGRLAKFEFQTNNECCIGYTHTKKLFVAYVKSKFNWASCISPANPETTAKKLAKQAPTRQQLKRSELLEIPGGALPVRRAGPAHRRKPPQGRGSASLPGQAPPQPRHPALRAAPGLCGAGKASCLQGAAAAAGSLRGQLGASALAALPVAGGGGPASGRPGPAVAIPVSLRPRGPPEPATMPLGLKPTCSVCKTTSSSMWKKGPQGEILCHHCTGRGGAGGGGAGSGAAGGTGGSGGGGGFGAASFASTSAAPPQSNGGGGGKQVSSSGPSRRRRPTGRAAGGGRAGRGLRRGPPSIAVPLLGQAAACHPLRRWSLVCPILSTSSSEKLNV